VLERTLRNSGQRFLLAERPLHPYMSQNIPDSKQADYSMAQIEIDVVDVCHCNRVQSIKGELLCALAPTQISTKQKPDV
jgi:hypothetical protein